jgi:hypothetical protein
MKRIGCSAFLGLAVCLVHAQISTVPSDVLGAHLNYGRGCNACHAPHSGAQGNGRASRPEPSSGTPALWGETVSGLDDRTIATEGGKYVETLRSSMGARTPDAGGLLACLSCHDGNLASPAMMRNRIYETLPPTYGASNTIPTLLAQTGAANGNSFSEHPVGLDVIIDCANLGWDCSESEGVISMKGARSSQFVRAYGLFIKPGKYNNTAVLMCDTCHDPHVMNTVAVGPGTRSGLPRGHYATMFFLRGPYNPASSTPGNNQAAQFCRQCHGQDSNEMNGSSAMTVF